MRSFLGRTRAEESVSLRGWRLWILEGIEDEAARSPLESALRNIWTGVLQVPPGGVGRGGGRAKPAPGRRRELTDKEGEAKETSHVRYDQELAVWKHGEDGI